MSNIVKEHQRFLAAARRLNTEEIVKKNGLTKLPDHTSKICPHCLKHSRCREYRRGAPIQWKDVPPDMPVKIPYRSSSKAWWNSGPIRWLIAPPDLPMKRDGTVDRDMIASDSFPWFLCWCIATCPACGPERVLELDCVRQFGLARQVLILPLKDMALVFTERWVPSG